MGKNRRRREKEREWTQSQKWGAGVTPGKPKQTGLLCVARRSVACGEGRTLTLLKHRRFTHEHEVYGVATEKNMGLPWGYRWERLSAHVEENGVRREIRKLRNKESGDKREFESGRFERTLWRHRCDKVGFYYVVTLHASTVAASTKAGV
ncbi:hypothetical protein KM043_015004 [Ampulex compressa]|nr:hypothetical protein KM043_015004 [Ampulex compressa]